jgi:O-antigen ligase
MAFAGFQAWRKPLWSPVYAGLIIWLLYFLWTIESVTGMGLSLLLLGFFMLRLVWTHAGRWVRRAALAGLLVIWAGSLVYVGAVVRDYFDVEDLDPAALEKATPSGEPYFHDLANQQLENGHYVWTYVAWGELAHGWSQRSNYAFEGKDDRGQQLQVTLIRYLTSKGLRKDAGGVAALTEQDVQRVEHGIASIAEVGAGGFRSRINKILLEVDIYRNGGNPGGNSVTQRLEFWKVGLGIFAEHPVLGVGTGDVPEAFDSAYESTGSRLKQKHRLRTHNQYLTLAIALGFPGLIWFLITLIQPARICGAWTRPMYLAFFIVASLSFLTEDTLETQAGVTFFAFFQSLLLLGVAWRNQRTDTLRQTV